MPAPALPLETYRKLFRKCIATRTPVDKFENYFNQLLSRSPIPPLAICETLLEPSITSNVSDPLHLNYIGRLVERDLVSLAHVLAALLKGSAVKSGAYELSGREPLEQDVFLVLAHVLRTRKPRSSESVWSAVAAVGEWMEAVMTGMLGEDAEAAVKLRSEALAELVLALGTNEHAVKILAEPGRREKKTLFRSSLLSFVQYVQVQNPPLASRLEELARAYQSPNPRAGKSDMDGMMLVMGEGQDLGPVVLTRAHLFVWLDSLLCGLPQVDDETVLGYLYNRYKDDTNTMVMDFVTAVIDVISNALVRNEPPSTLFLLRSFLCNKVPLILNRISPSSLTSSYAISQSFLRTDVATLVGLPTSHFEPFGNSSNSGTDAIFGDITVDLRQDFLFACALHGVIGEQDIQGILGELPLGAMSGSGRYDYREILAQCAADPGRVDQLLEEVEGVEGNSGAVVKALFEVMKNMCESRETMPLRNICSFLARKPSSIDVMLLFFKPAEILEPLCDLLDTWRYEEDQGEYQPVYEEFGYILLLVLTIVKRYSLTTSDLACSHPPNNDAFVPKLLHRLSTPERIEDLSPDRQAQLGGWIKELYEDEGISDNLMMSCRPQDFYRLVPTLFSQSLLCIQRGVLDLDAVKEAFSFLLTPFLLPSVISGLTWLTAHLWAQLDNAAPTLAIIASLVIAPNLPPETAEIHRTVLAIAAHSLSDVLRALISRPGVSQDTVHTAQQIERHIRPHVGFRRAAIPSREEHETWVHAAGTGGIAAALAGYYNSLVMWNGGGGGGGVQNSSRLLVDAHMNLGPQRCVEIVVAEAEKMKAAGQAGVAEDVAAAVLGRLVAGRREWLGTARGEVAREVYRRVEAAYRRWTGQGVAQAEAELGVIDGMDLMMGEGEFGGGMLLGMEM